MPRTFIVDTCTIINFAAVARLDLLETALEGRGHWTESAANEINRAADHWPALRTVPVAGWLGEPIAPGREGDTDAVFRLQRQLGGTRREPRKHLAEAEAIHLVLSITSSSARDRFQQHGQWCVGIHAQEYRSLSFGPTLLPPVPTS